MTAVKPIFFIIQIYSREDRLSMVKEEFKTIQGYEGLYEISNIGNVKSLPKFKGNGYYTEEKILKPKLDKYGYYAVCLRKNNKNIYTTIHRLVAGAFIDNTNEYKIVNHIDGNKQNNEYLNLEWTTISGNTKHAYNNDLGDFKDNLAIATEKARIKNTYTIIVYQNDKYLGEFEGKEACAEMLNISPKTIYNSLFKNMKNRKGYKFILKEGVM